VAGRILRAAIVGASTLLGKELADELNAATTVVWDLKLFDAELADAGVAGGQVTAAGDEVLLIQTITPGAFDGMDVVFFAGDAATTRRHWKEAKAGGAKIVDLSAALDDEPGVLVRCALIDATERGGAGAVQVLVAAHPAAVMLALVMTRLRARWVGARGVVTVMEPASQQGSAGLDEMHQQTVALLSFQAVPKDIYDAQVAFNLSSGFGAEAKVDLGAIRERVRRDFATIAGGEAASAVAVQLLQAPVFHGYTASMFVEMDGDAVQADVESAIGGGIVSVMTGIEPGPSNLSATEQGQVLVSVRAEADAATLRGFWIWMAADNLKLAAQNAVACALELVAVKQRTN
jgi:aspartate-semialdehyde dehydrogenase